MYVSLHSKAVLPGYRSDAVMQRGEKPPLRRGTVGQSGDGWTAGRLSVFVGRWILSYGQATRIGGTRGVYVAGRRLNGYDRTDEEGGKE